MTEIQNSKIAFLLSSCIRFSHKFYKHTIKKHEKNKIVGTLHNFDLCIRFNKFEEGDKSDFSVRDTDFYFYDIHPGDTKGIFSEWLQMKNNKFLSESEIRSVWDKLVSKNINLNAYQFIPILTIATLIKMYKNIYKYLFVPVIINYGVEGNNIRHQSALIIDFSGKILFYEPYGRYSKFNKSYAKCLTNLFSIYESFIGDATTTDTYHNYIYSPNPNNCGIQNFIFSRNNDELSTFSNKYNKLVDDMHKLVNTYDIKNTYMNDLLSDIKNNLIVDLEKNNDKTLIIVYILSKLSNVDLDSPDLQNIGFLDQFKEIYNNALCMYYNYNSQTCVTITIYELNEFFKIADEYYAEMNKKYSVWGDGEDVEIIEQKQREYILKLYEEFRVSENPNKLLLCNINEIINNFELVDYKKTPSNVNIKTIMKNRRPNKNTCKMFRYDIE